MRGCWNISSLALIEKEKWDKNRRTPVAFRVVFIPLWRRNRDLITIAILPLSRDMRGVSHGYSVQVIGVLAKSSNFFICIFCYYKSKYSDK